MLLTMAIAVTFPLLAMEPADSASASSPPNQSNSTVYIYSYQDLFDRAREEAQSGEYQAAINTYSELLVQYPEDVDGLLGRGLAYSWAGQYDLAEADLSRVISLAPGYTDAWAARGNLYRWTGRAELAVNDHKQWATLDPESPEPHLAIALDLFEIRHFADARLELDIAEKLGAEPSLITERRARLNRIPQATNWELWAGLDRYARDLFPDGLFDDNSSDFLLFGVRRRLPGGVIGVELMKSAEIHYNYSILRFDLWHDLPSGFYTNARMAAPPMGEGMEGGSYLFAVDLYRPLPYNFEGLAGIYASTESDWGDGGGIDGWAAGLGWYNGPIYISLKYTENDYTGFGENTVLGRIRAYTGNVDRYIEFLLTNTDYLSSVIDEVAFTNRSYALFIHNYVTDSVGFEVLLQETAYDYSDSFASESQQMTVRLLFRF